MSKILITGATGNVGVEVLAALQKLNNQVALFAGVRNTSHTDEKIAKFNVNLIQFDFTDSLTFLPAFEKIDILFLLRPPQISDVNKYFKPLIEAAEKAAIKHIVFLSVQGVEKSKIIPHHKIEKLIVDSNIPYTFLRPAYFMQNFTGSLQDDLVHHQRIYLPAGKAKFTIVDVEDIGDVAAKVLTNLQLHANKSYELTNNELLTFGEMADELTAGLDRQITFVSPNLIQYFINQRKKGVPTMFIFVLMMLHYLPRFQKTPKRTQWVKEITGREPHLFSEFIRKNKNELQ